MEKDMVMDITNSGLETPYTFVHDNLSKQAVAALDTRAIINRMMFPVIVGGIGNRSSGQEPYHPK